MALLLLFILLTSVFIFIPSLHLVQVRFCVCVCSFSSILNIMLGPFDFNFPCFLMYVFKSINFPLIAALATPHRV